MKKGIKSSLFLMILISILFLSRNIYASSFMSERAETNYSTNEGLTSGRANDIVQSEDGYIWIAQYTGLTRYNSKVFEDIEETSEGYNLNGCQALATIDNEIYIGTQKGMFQYKDGVYNKIDILNSEFSVNDIEIVADSVFFATSIGTYVYSRKNESCSRINYSQSSSRESIDLGYDDSDFYYVTKDNVVYQSVSPVSTYYSSLENPVKSIYCYQGHVYIGTTNGHLIVDKTTDIEIHAGSSINDILYKDDELYIATDRGLYIYDFDNVREVSGLKCSKSIEKIMFDYEGNLWLASSETGVSKITRNELLDYFFEYEIREWFQVNGVSDTAYTINAIEKYKGLTYIATGEGIVVVDEETHSIVENDISESLINIRIRDLEIFNNVLYIATYDTSDYDLIAFDGTTKYLYNASNLTEDGSAVASAGQVRTLVSTESSLIIGTNYGISSFDGVAFTSKELDARPLYLYASNDNIYACLENIGVVKISSDLQTQIKIDPTHNHASLKVLDVNGVLFFNDTAALLYYKDGEINTVNVKFQGTIMEILYINESYIIATDLAVYKIDGDILSPNVEYDIYDKSSGLKTSIVANASGYYDEDNNTYYFAALDGVYLLSLDERVVETGPIKFAIDGVFVDGNRKDGNTIRVSKNTNRIIINYSVLSFLDSDNYTVYYRLDGVEKKWQEKVTPDTSITYTNLSGGKYTFQLKVVSNDTGEFNIINVNIIKQKLFIEQPAFWILSSILLIALILSFNFLIIRIRTKASLKRQNEYRAITVESLQAIARTIDAKDEYTNGHSFRVGQYAKIMAKELGYKDEDIDNVYYTALLHDIGKIGIPLEILNKPGRLTDEEFEVIKTHTVKGLKILEGITTIPDITAGAKYHHERIDGKGYPDGLAGDDIPLVARIIACCDTFDAMATRRSYKEPYSKEKIIAEFERVKGTQLDSVLTDLVIKLIKEGKLEIDNGYDPNLKINEIDESKKDDYKN